MNKRAKFLRAAEQLEHKSVYSPVFSEPFPDWCLKVVLRFARVFIPELRIRDVVENPEKFVGHMAGFVADLIDRAKKVRLSELPRGKQWKLLRTEIMSIRRNGPQRLRHLKKAVAELPRRNESEFYRAYADMTRNDGVDRAVQRLNDSNTAKICFFVLCMRPHIEARRFRSVSDLGRAFMRLEQLDPERKKFLSTNEDARLSLERQFRDICSEDGLKLRPRGRPPKNLPAAA